MRVKISYSVDLDQVPAHATSMLNKGAQELKYIVDKLEIIESCLNSEGNMIKILDDISSVREKMFKVDTQLGDIVAILSGYERAILGAQVAEHAEQAAPGE